MTKKYLCFVNKDYSNNELELMNKDNYPPNLSSTNPGAIHFKSKFEMNDYFNNYCVSEEQLKNNGNSLFSFLFFLLLFIFIITLVCQMLNKSSSSTNTANLSSFGRFSF